MYRNPYLSGRYGNVVLANPTGSDDDDVDRHVAVKSDVEEQQSVGGYSIRPLPPPPPLGISHFDPEAESFRADLGFSRFPNAPHMTLSVFSPKVAALTNRSADDSVPAPPSLQAVQPAVEPSPTAAAVHDPPPYKSSGAINSLIAETEAAMKMAHELLATSSASIVPLGFSDRRGYYEHADLPVVPLPAQPNEHVVTPLSSPTPSQSPHQEAPTLEAPSQAEHPESIAEPKLESAVLPPSGQCNTTVSRVDEPVPLGTLTVHLLKEEELCAVIAKRMSRRAPPHVTPTSAPVQHTGSAPTAVVDVNHNDEKPSKKPSKRRSSDRSSRGDKKKGDNTPSTSPPVVPISAVTELVSSIVALVNKRTEVPAAAPPPPQTTSGAFDPSAPKASSEPPRPPVRVLPPPQVVVGQQPLFSQTSEPTRSPYFSAPSLPLAVAPQVLPSVLLPRVGVNDATVQKVVGTVKSRTDSPQSSSSGSRRDHYLHPTESWLSKGPELHGVHLHLRKSSLTPLSVQTKDRVSEFNRHAKDYLRLHKR